ncbi:MAG TPA: trigger factor [Steroidobacteraceae bacterium]|nr:trigger factor [Steroidobacteraceae bacterium]
MQVSVTATGGLERRLEVAVPAAQVSQEVEQRLKRISRTARLKGFRPGKAPLGVVRKQFGEQVHAEVVGDLMRSSFAEAVSQEKLKPAAGPRIEPITLQPGGDLKFAAVFEILPEVQLQSLERIAIERPTAEITEVDVDAMIESMRRQNPHFTEVSRAARAQDRVTVDYDGRIEGNAFEGGEGRDVAFIVGSGRVLQDIEAAVVGATAGEQRTVAVHYPQGHGNTQLAGRTAEFLVTLKKVEEQHLPEVDAEFCRAFGVEDASIPSLREEVRRSMQRELDGVIRNRLRAQVLDALYRENPLEVPRSLIDESVQQLQLEMAQRTGVRDAKQLPARDSFVEPARRRVALGIIVGEIVRAEGLKVDRARVAARLEDLAASYPDPEQARRAYLGNADAMRQLESAVLEDQVLDFVLTRARVSERAMSFKELTGFGPDEAPAPEQQAQTAIVPAPESPAPGA